jgi:hypothetical protein
MANLESAKDKNLLPKSGDHSGKKQSFPMTASVSKETSTEVFKKAQPEVKREGRVLHMGKAKLNKGGAARVSD